MVQNGAEWRNSSRKGVRLPGPGGPGSGEIPPYADSAGASGGNSRRIYGRHRRARIEARKHWGEQPIWETRTTYESPA